MPIADTMQPPRQALPPGADAMESPQCICTSHLPSRGGNCLLQIRCNHPVRLCRRVQTRCDCSSVSVLVISLPEEGNCLGQIRCNHPVRLRRRVQTRCNCSSVSVLVISPPQERNCQVQTRHNHPVRLCLSPLRRRRIALCRPAITTLSGFACHPSAGGELSSADPPQPPRQASPATPPQEGN